MKSVKSVNTLAIWDRVKQPPKSALKTIKGGRSKGMTDINPQWRYQVMTEVFGVCGIGWKFYIDQLWHEPASEEQVFCFAKVSVYIKDGNEWSDPIYGVGGNMLIKKEAAGLHISDEGYKMAITDALSTALKMLGVGADIYAGKWDGSKYNTEQTAPVVKPTPQPKKDKTPVTLDAVVIALMDTKPYGMIVNRDRIEEILSPIFKGDIPPLSLAETMDGLRIKYGKELYIEDTNPY